MAKEIMCLGKPDGKTFSFLFFWAVDNPIALPGWDGSVEQGGANVVPTPSDTLPEEVAGEFTMAEKAALDAGTWAFVVVMGFVDDSVDDATLGTIVQAQYALEETKWQAEYQLKYNRYGKRYDAT